MPYDSKAVANYLLDLAERDGVNDMTPMKLLKLVYIAHGWHLALTGEPLISEKAQAWQYGPVVPRLYHEFKEFGNQRITRRAAHLVKTSSGRVVREVPRIDSDDSEAAIQTREIVDRTWELYKKFSGIQLSNKTHESGSPWDTSVRDASAERLINVDIDNPRIKDYYEKLLVDN